MTFTAVRSCQNPNRCPSLFCTPYPQFMFLHDFFLGLENLGVSGQSKLEILFCFLDHPMISYPRSNNEFNSLRCSKLMKSSQCSSFIWTRNDCVDQESPILPNLKEIACVSQLRCLSYYSTFIPGRKRWFFQKWFWEGSYILVHCI